MATTEIKAKLTLDGVKEAADGIKKVGDEGEAAAKKIDGAFGKADIGGKLKSNFDQLRASFTKFTASAVSARAGFANIAAGAEQMAAGVQRGVKAISLLGVAVGGAVTAAGLLANKSADTAEAIQNQADAFGISFDNMQKLRDAINAVGGDEGLLTRALTKFTIAATDADGATDELGNNIKKFSGATQTGLPGLIEYAKSLEKFKTTQEQLAQVSKDFGAKGATTLLAFLRQLGTEFDATRAAADKMLPALDQIGQANLADLDTASDKLTTNFSRLGLLVGSRIAPAFTALYDTIREIVGTVGPALADALGQIATSFAEGIIANKSEIIAFAKDVATSVFSLARDIRDALAGINRGGKQNWITKLKDDVVGAFNFIKATVTNVLIPAFKSVGAALDPVAKLLNGIFGQNFTGNGLLLALIVGKLSGAFALLGGTLKIATGGLQVFLAWTLGGKAKVLEFIAVIGQLATTARLAGIAITGFLIANPLIGALVLGLGGLAATVGYLATRQTDAEKATQAHANAMKELANIQDLVNAGLDDGIQKLEDWKNAQFAAGAQALNAATAQLEALRAERAKVIADMQGKGSDNNVALAEATQKVRQQLAVVEQLQIQLGTVSVAYLDTKASIDKATASQRKLNAEALAGAGAANQVAEGYKRITLYGPGGVLKTFDVPTEKLLEARRQVDGLAQALQQPAAGNGILEEATARATGFIAAIQGLAEQVNMALIDLSASASAQVAALVDALPQFFDGLPEAIGAAFGGVAAAIQSVWAQAMAGIVDQTRSMVRAVQSLISSLQSYLANLTTAIGRAQAAASTRTSTTSSFSGAAGRASGGYIRGPGTSISDSIPAWLSNGEFVVKAAAVRKYGVAFLQAINGMRAGFNMKDGFPGFAMGGLVGVPAMAMPSLGGSRSSLTLVLDGQSFGGLSAPADTLSALEKAVRQKRLRATGRGSPYAAR